MATSPDAQLLADFGDADTVLNALNLPTTTDVHRRLQNAADALSAAALGAPVLLPVPIAFRRLSKQNSTDSTTTTWSCSAARVRSATRSAA